MKTKRSMYSLIGCILTAFMLLAACENGTTGKGGKGGGNDGADSGTVPTALRGKWVNDSYSVEFTVNKFRSTDTGASWYKCRVTDTKIEYYGLNLGAGKCLQTPIFRFFEHKKWPSKDVYTI